MKYKFQKRSKDKSAMPPDVECSYRQKTGAILLIGLGLAAVYNNHVKADTFDVPVIQETQMGTNYPYFK